MCRECLGYEALSPDIPASVAQAGFSRCALVIALEGLAPEIAWATAQQSKGWI